MIVETGAQNQRYHLKNLSPEIENTLLDAEELTINSADGLKLKAYAFRPIEAKGTIIFLHGIRASKDAYLKTVPMFLSWGFNILLIDHRAHGE
ncbi:MAG: hypothetical protein KDC92_08385, partial [Bacteroidetes bacterium]|nr:hypothetical protein [Bacteroidota bacterium]